MKTEPTVLICNNCKEYWIAPKGRCTCGSAILTQTHSGNAHIANNFKTPEILEDVLMNLFNDKYTKEEIIDTLAWGERNNDIYFPLVEKYQPDYYNHADPIFPVLSCTILLDLEKNGGGRRFLSMLKSLSK